MIRPIKRGFKKLYYTVAAILKVVIFFNIRGRGLEKCSGSDECIILGTGPSLRDYLVKNSNSLKDKYCLVVNNFSLTSAFVEIKPAYYLVLDPNFWQEDVDTSIEQYRQTVYNAINERCDWNMTLFISIRAKKFIKKLRLRDNIHICYFSGIIVIGFDAVKYFLYKKNWGFPESENVLVAAIFLCLNMGYKKIFLLGADHSWHKQICVSNDNNVYITSDHFYDKRQPPVCIYYKDGQKTQPFKIHELFQQWSNVFKQYHDLNRYASHLGAKVYNASKVSYIDAFERV